MYTPVTNYQTRRKRRRLITSALLFVMGVASLVAGLLTGEEPPLVAAVTATVTATVAPPTATPIPPATPTATFTALPPTNTPTSPPPTATRTPTAVPPSATPTLQPATATPKPTPTADSLTTPAAITITTGLTTSITQPFTGTGGGGLPTEAPSLTDTLPLTGSMAVTSTQTALSGGESAQNGTTTLTATGAISGSVADAFLPTTGQIEQPAPASRRPAYFILGIILILLAGGVLAAPEDRLLPPGR